MKQLIAASAITGTLAAALMHSAPAQAAYITLDINPTTAFSSNPTATGASGKLAFDFQQVDPDTVRLLLKIINTTGQTNYPDDANATAATLVGVGFDLPSLVASFSYEQQSTGVFPTLFTNAALTPFTNNPEPGYPGGRLDVGIRSSTGGTFNGGNPNGGLTAGQSATVSFLLNAAVNSTFTSSQVGNAFFAGFKNVDGNGPYPTNDQLRAALRFQQVNAGAGSDKLLATPEAVPTPALLPGLVGLALGALRKKRQEQLDN